MMEKCISFNIRKASRVVSMFFNQDLLSKNLPLNIAQIQMLQFIHENNFCNTTEISRLMAMDRTTASRNCSLLEKNGYLFKTIDLKNSLSKILRLTIYGEKALDEHMEVILKSQDRLKNILNLDLIDSDKLNNYLNSIIRIQDFNIKSRKC